MRSAGQIAIGLVAIASVLPVAWFSFGWYIAVGIIITLVYGAAAVTIGATCIAGGTVQLLRDRRRKALDPIPPARALDR